ncbi:E3 ubiquitin-protein ligase UHRF1 [Biomphalaria pfeifferi]|uniref:E3 ubiquitin-protein ligase UHRF1 n=1 Tax=Biomphalaria pfeifferi TaxID=112525 RepID=A0AAD8B771_BIOPF|nr:E3 ubiquitin-protein ligase UHRF1 [Biomphalaria pfeifferi]
MHDYEAIRKKNLEDNKRILASFGLLDPFKSLPSIIKRSNQPTLIKPAEKARKRKASSDFDNFVGGSIHGSRRKSARLQGKEVSEVSQSLDQDVESDEDKKPVIKVQANRPNFYGAVPDIEVGTVWSTRMECCRDGVHRPTVAGIHGGELGAYSIALSGGYEDDVDLGECFTYTGEGGRDLKGTKANPKNLRTAPQSKDQALTRGNLALSKNVETGNPVRVIRGYKLDSPFAPESGYRYDGLYSVEKSWFTIGLSGYGVWKFALKRCGNQASPPWTYTSEPGSPEKNNIDEPDVETTQNSTDADTTKSAFRNAD